MRRFFQLLCVTLLASLWMPVWTGISCAAEPKPAASSEAARSERVRAERAETQRAETEGAQPERVRTEIPRLEIARTEKGRMGTAPVKAAPTDADQNGEPDAGDVSLNYSPQWPEPPNTGAMLLRLCLGTVFVLALCVVSLWLGKPWLQKLQAATTTGGQALRIEGSVTLGNRVVLYLVKVGDTQLVAGTDLTGLKSLIALPPSFKEVLDGQLPGGVALTDGVGLPGGVAPAWEDALAGHDAAVEMPAPNWEPRLRTAAGA